MNEISKKRLQKRLEKLKAEFKVGRQMIAELERKQNNLHETLLRISGAIQILEELLNEEHNGDLNNSHYDDSDPQVSLEQSVDIFAE